MGRRKKYVKSIGVYQVGGLGDTDVIRRVQYVLGVGGRI